MSERNEEYGCIQADIYAAIMNQTWQPIETAPKDGSHILLFWPKTNEYPTGDGYRVEGARWYSKEECVGPTRYWEPSFVSISQTAHHFCGMTHWMPCPKPPTS